MNILVCIKHAYVPSTNIALDKDPPWVRYNPMSFRMNTYDEYAIEEALRIKEHMLKNNEKTNVHVISIGPDRVEPIIRRAMEMGADEGIHIYHDNEGLLSPYQIAYLIASYAKDKQYSMILTGVMAEDDMYMQTGQMIAGILGYPHISSVIYQEVKMQNDQASRMDKDHGSGDSEDHRSNNYYVYVERECDAKQSQAFEIAMPCVLTIQSGINKPRYPSLSNVLRAKQQKIIKINAMDMQIPEARETIVRIFQPEMKPKGIFLNGTSQEKAIQLLKILHEKSFI